MRMSHKNSGFSLTEVLLSIGVLAIGMIFVAGVFPVGIYFSTISTERTIAAVIADEAFAKVRLYDVDLASIPPTGCVDFNNVPGKVFDPNEYAYPSDPNIPLSQKTYHWSAMCRLSGDPNSPIPIRLVQVTILICRKAIGEDYWSVDDPTNPTTLEYVDYPKPFRVSVSQSTGLNPDELFIEPIIFTYGGYSIDQKTFINDGYKIVDNATGQLYRVLERYAHDPETPDRDRIILLDRPWQSCISCSQQRVWVVPPPVGGGRNPCIAVYQKLIRF